jgi:hypothetical protein
MSDVKGYSSADYAEAYGRLKSFTAVARELGVNESTVRRSLKSRAEDPAIAASMQAVGTGMRPALAWAKTKPDDGGLSYSVLLKPEPLPDETLYRIREAFEGMTPAVPVIPLEHVLSDLCNVIPLFDVHFGMRAWGLETGGPDYDVEIATADLKYAFEKVLQLTPMAERAVLIIGGDFFHADDNRSETPSNKHKLDTDGRHHRVIEDAIEALGYVIARVQSRHRETVIRVLRGNHDEHSHMVLSFALSQRFRNDPSLTVDMSPRDLFMHQWGRAAIFAHHGDRAPPERLTLYVSDVCPFWSDTRHRHFYTGHIHKDTARDIGPLRWESLRAFCPPDAYAAGMGYAGRRAMRIDTYHKVDGRVLTAMDPIERDAT